MGLRDGRFWNITDHPRGSGRSGVPLRLGGHCAKDQHWTDRCGSTKVAKIRRQGGLIVVGVKKKVIALALAPLLLTFGCATQAPMVKTPSGRPEAIFHNSSPEEVRSKLSSACLDAGLVISDSTNNAVMCTKQMEGMQAALAQMAIGNAYSTAPVQSVRFNLVNTDAGVRVQAFQWIETQMPFGQINRQELNAGAQFNEIQQLLYNLGGQSL